MRVSEALGLISGFYVPGVVTHYAKMKPDPWQKTMDDFEKIMSIVDQTTLTPMLNSIVARLEKLVQDFKRMGVSGSQSLPPVDALYLGDAKRVAAHFSRKRKECVHCQKKEGLRIVPVSSDGIDVMLVCLGCFNKK